MKKYVKEIDGKKYFITEWPGNGPTIIGVHGLTGNYAHMMRLAEELTPQYRFISYDVRGRGDSSPADKDSNILRHADELIKIIEALNIKKPMLIGHSMGAYISASVASKYKDIAGIVLLEGSGIITYDEYEKIKPSLNRLSMLYSTKQEYVENSRNIYPSMGLNWSKYVEASVEHEVGQINDGQSYRFKGEANPIINDFKSAVEYDHNKILSQIECPVLLVVALGNLGNKPLYSPEAYKITRQLIKNIEYFETKNNHYTMCFDPEPELLDIIKSFIKKSIG